MDYKTTRRFDKAFLKLPEALQEKFFKQIDLLLKNSRHPSLGVRKMAGTQNIFEARVDIHIRFTFYIEGPAYILRNIGSHDAAYRNP